MFHQINGFLKKPRRNALKKLYRGRFTCPDVQWIGNTSDQFCTFTVTAGELSDAAANNLLWTDQDVQRGIHPAAVPVPAREISLAAGYPNTSQYIFDQKKADEIVQKLLNGEQLFLSPLVWNLRPDSFQAYWNEEENEIYLYEGKIYLPDSHHRHQAIIKATQLWRDSPSEFKKFTEERQFKVELYFLSRQNEGNYFFDKNQLPKPTSKSKAYDLTTQDDLSLLAKRVTELSTNLHGNVNRVTDRFDAKNAQVMTLSTLREMMRAFAATDSIDSSELDGLATVAADFYDMLADVRPELALQNASDRRRIRFELIVDAAVMMHGYAAVMKEYNFDIANIGRVKAKDKWRNKLIMLSSENQFQHGRWKGELFDKKNPLWMAVGVLKVGSSGKITVLNTGAARGECGRVLRQLMSLDKRPRDLTFLSKR
jgi:hypothetical protein